MAGRWEVSLQVAQNQALGSFARALNWELRGQDSGLNDLEQVISLRHLFPHMEKLPC